MLHGTHKGGWISSCQALAMLNQLFQDGWSLGTHIIYPHGPWIMRVSWNGARRTGPVTCGPSLCVWTLCLPASRHLFHSELAARGEPKTTGGAKVTPSTAEELRQHTTRVGTQPCRNTIMLKHHRAATPLSSDWPTDRRGLKDRTMRRKQGALIPSL